MRISLIFAIIFASLAINAQNTNPKLSSSSSEVTHLEKGSKSTVHSAYAGMEKKIIKALKGDVIPAHFPKYAKGQSFEAYKLVIRKWSKNNISLFTDEHKAKLKAKKN